MSEDKMREEFEKQYAGYKLTRDGEGYFYGHEQNSWDEFKECWKSATEACAAIKDAEIAKLHTLVDAQTVCLQEHQAEIAELKLDLGKAQDRAVKLGHPKSSKDTRDEIELFLRDSYAAGCKAAQERSLYTAMDYANREAPRLRTLLENLRDTEIASHDLMIKELRGSLLPFAALLQEHNESGDDSKPIFGINSALITLGDLRKASALAKSEHHNSRALERMLLEAKQQEREHWANEFSDALQSDLENGVKWLNEKASQDFRDYYPALNHVLAELNKE